MRWFKMCLVRPTSSPAGPTHPTVIVSPVAAGSGQPHREHPGDPTQPTLRAGSHHLVVETPAGANRCGARPPGFLLDQYVSRVVSETYVPSGGTTTGKSPTGWGFRRPRIEADGPPSPRGGAFREGARVMFGWIEDRLIGTAGSYSSLAVPTRRASAFVDDGEAPLHPGVEMGLNGANHLICPGGRGGESQCLRVPGLDLILHEDEVGKQLLLGLGKVGLGLDLYTGLHQHPFVEDRSVVCDFDRDLLTGRNSPLAGGELKIRGRHLEGGTRLVAPITGCRNCRGDSQGRDNDPTSVSRLSPPLYRSSLPAARPNRQTNVLL